LSGENAIILIYFSRLPDIRKIPDMGVLRKGRSMLLQIRCQLDLSGKLWPFCLQHANSVCRHSKSEAFWTCHSYYKSAGQLNGISMVTLMLTRQLRLEQKAHTVLCRNMDVA